MAIRRSRWLPPRYFRRSRRRRGARPCSRWCLVRHDFLVTQEGGINPIIKTSLNGSSEDFVRTAYTRSLRASYRSDTSGLDASGLDAMPTPYQGNAMDEVRRAAEAANRVDVLLFPAPGGRYVERRAQHVPAKEIVERMVSEASQI